MGARAIDCWGAWAAGRQPCAEGVTTRRRRRLQWSTAHPGTTSDWRRPRAPRDENSSSRRQEDRAAGRGLSS
eukprot:731879-Prymnesium_polylepis.1